MQYKRITALALAVSMLAPMITSCAKSNTKNIVVKEDDPWYESVRFDLETDKLPSEMIDSSVVTYGNDKLYHLYSLTNLSDFDNYRRTMLDTYDSNGNLLNQIKVTDPGNYSITMINNIKPGKDGNTAEAIAELFGASGFETAIITIDLISGEAKDPRPFRNADGSNLELQEGNSSWAGVTDVYTAGDYYFPVIYASGYSTSSTVYIYSFVGSEYKCEFDMSELPDIYNLDEFSYDSISKTVFTIGYTRNDGPLVLEFDPETGKLINSTKYDAQNTDDINLAEYQAVTSGELCRIDTLGNITAFDMQSQEVKTVIENNWYTPYFSDLSREEVKLIACSDEEAVIYSSKSTEYSMFFSGIDETVTILKRADKNPHAGKTVIELATPIDTKITEYMSNAIYEFNRTDNEYLIRVWSKYNSGLKAGRDLSVLNEDDEKLYTMIQELKGREAPDLAIGIQKNYAMRDDIFEDLTGYLDQEIMDKQFTNIIEASKIGGKLYFLPVTLEIEGLVTDTSLINNGACGITFEDYENLVTDKLDGFSPYDYPLSTYNNKKDFMLSCIDTKSAIEGNNVEFGTDQFNKAVESSNEYFADDGFTPAGDYDWNEEVKRVRGACRYDRIESFTEFIHACKSSEGSYTIIGTPSVNASGPRFRALETISVTSSSGSKEGCRKFINFLFSGAGFGDADKEFQNIVTNKDVMAKNIALISEENNKGQKTDEELSDYITELDDYCIVYGYKESTKAMEEGMMNSLSTISVYYYDDPVITAFLIEEISPYYAGDRPLEDAVRILNDRVEKYIEEM
ncbi:MAG: hypothetical protein Q4C15_03620 [Eubacteriales bacterium]|nr:hypothetical protein [Eubacteriales bacterium]